MNHSDVAISYSSTISYNRSHVSKMVANAFRLLELDRENCGTPEWNPLGAYVHPKDLVLIKPNLVMHDNPSGDGTECLYTQSSVVEAVIDFVVVALKGSGRIIVGDAPMQGCHFDELTEKSGYKNLIRKYQEKGIDINLRDFRNTVSETVNGVVIEKERHRNESVLADLGGVSAFAGLSGDRIKNMRVTNYDPRILQAHHSTTKHEYLIAKEILDADVVINMPKPKTHRKAGVTGALKNLVGINCSKEYLPHHTRQTRAVQGDAFLHRDRLLELSDTFADKKCRAEKLHRYKRALFYRYAGGLFHHMGKRVAHEKFSEGSWYGNDTIWRTILDLNTILQYADREGRICKERQRRYFNVGDMIISGEKDGPVNPSKKEAGVILAGEDPCSFDEVVTALMGFDRDKIPTIKHMREVLPAIYLEDTYRIRSDYEVWDGQTAADIYENHNLGFVPNPGWREVL